MGCDAVAVLKADHRKVEALFGQLESGTRAGRRLEEIVRQVIIELVQHDAAEEGYLYPFVQAHLADGERLAEHGLNAHTGSEQIMKALEEVSTDSVEFDVLVRELITAARHHIRAEERDLFPRLEASVSKDRLADLGAQLGVMRTLMPTRGDAPGPEHPRWSEVFAPGAGLIDRIRQAINARPRPH